MDEPGEARQGNKGDRSPETGDWKTKSSFLSPVSGFFEFGPAHGWAVDKRLNRKDNNPLLTENEMLITCVKKRLRPFARNLIILEVEDIQCQLPS
ncbi:MAG: hypothetical protein ACE5EK_01355 [Nitrospinales bacterium]